MLVIDVLHRHHSWVGLLAASLVYLLVAWKLALGVGGLSKKLPQKGPRAMGIKKI